MKKVVWMNDGYDKDWVEESGITPEELKKLEDACMSWFYAEMSDSYAVTLSEEESIEKRVKDLVDKYNLKHCGTTFWAQY